MVDTLPVFVSVLNRVLHLTSRVSDICFSILFQVGFPINFWILQIFLLLFSVPSIKDVPVLSSIYRYVSYLSEFAFFCKLVGTSPCLG